METISLSKSNQEEVGRLDERLRESCPLLRPLWCSDTGRPRVKGGEDDDQVKQSVEL